MNHGFLADFLWRRTRDPRALEHVAQAVRLEPAYAWAWDQLRDWSPPGENRAVALARELTGTRTGEADSWLRLAQVLPDDQLTERLAALDRALELNPRHIRTHDLRAFLLADAGRYDEAAAACAPAVFGKDIPRTLAGRAAWVKFVRGNVKGALAAMREVAAAEPDYYWAWECIADWSESLGEHQVQREAAERMVRLSPRSAIPLGYLAAAEFKLERPEAALELLRRAFVLDPGYGYAGHSRNCRAISPARPRWPPKCASSPRKDRGMRHSRGSPICSAWKSATHTPSTPRPGRSRTRDGSGRSRRRSRPS